MCEGRRCRSRVDGRVLGRARNISSSFADVGAIYGGAPSVSLTAQCGPAAPSGSPLCNQAQSDVAAEQQKLRNKAAFLRWYPVVSLGIAVRF